MASVGVIVHLDRAEAGALARQIGEDLAASDHDVRVPRLEAKAAGLDSYAVDDLDFGPELDLVVTLGGDGSILRAVELIGESEVPILGVDFGVLGYLTEVPPDEARAAVRRALVGDHQFEERMLVAVETRLSGGPVERHVALNEAAVERSAEVNTLRLAVHIDGEFFTTYAVDGLIVATPTGSTAYAFSAGGPIIDPTHSAMLMTPVSPHMLFDRSLVLTPDTELTVSVDGHRPASLSVDGRRITVLGDGDAIVCTASPRPVRLVTFGPRHFHRVLKEKFGLNDR